MHTNDLIKDFLSRGGIVNLLKCCMISADISSSEEDIAKAITQEGLEQQAVRHYFYPAGEWVVTNANPVAWNVEFIAIDQQTLRSLFYVFAVLDEQDATLATVAGMAIRRSLPSPYRA